MYYHAPSGKYVVCYGRASDGVIVMVTGTAASNGVITFGNETEVYSAYGLYQNPVRLAYCQSIDCFVVQYWIGTTQPYIKAVTVNSSGVPTAGTSAGGPTYSATSEMGDIAWDTSVSRLVWVYPSGLGYAVSSIYTVDATALTFGNTGTNTSNYGISYPRLAYDPVNAKMCMFGMSSNILVGFVGTTSTTNISYGSQVTLTGTIYSTASLRMSIIFNSSLNLFGITYANSNPATAVLSKMIGVSGSSFTVGTQDSQSGQGWGNGIAYDPVYNRMVLFYMQASTSYPAFRIGTVSGTTLTYGSETVLRSFSASYITPIFSAFNSTTNTVGCGLTYDTAITYSNTITIASSTLTANNFIGFSTSSYTNGQTATVTTLGGLNTNQTSLTPATKYYLTLSGSLTTTTTTIPAGQAISSTSLLVKA
jgi:hypothetical protein